ncbi:hypothetical protein [Aminobacterium colombiense]
MRNRTIDVPCPDLETLLSARVNQVAQLRAAFPASNLDGGGWTLRKVIAKLARGWDFTSPHGPLGVAQFLWDSISEELLDAACEVRYEKSERGWGCGVVVVYAWTITGMDNPPSLELPEEAGRGRTRYFVENHTDGFTVWFEE